MPCLPTFAVDVCFIEQMLKIDPFAAVVRVGREQFVDVIATDFVREALQSINRSVLDVGRDKGVDRAQRPQCPVPRKNRAAKDNVCVGPAMFGGKDEIERLTADVENGRVVEVVDIAQHAGAWAEATLQN